MNPAWTRWLPMAGWSIAACAVIGFALAQPSPSAQEQAGASTDDPVRGTSSQVELGRYLTALGDCVACHTERGGDMFAGGRPVETPFGTILSANLTPDEKTGIGRYTAGTFYRALHEGLDAEGQHLYPAFPYNYYTRITRADSDAIFAYLRSLPSVEKRIERNQLSFPYSMRWLMTVWNWLFLDKGPYRTDASKSAEWNRGAYLVEGLGHCQACHTPHNALGGTKRDEPFRGGAFGLLFAPDITPNDRIGIGRWSPAELRDFLRKGNNAHSAASAEMGEVVTFSTSQMNAADLSAVISYLATVPASPTPRVDAPEEQVMKQGRAIWEDECSACHRADGEGVAHMFPKLAGNPNVQQTNATTVLRFILAGTRRASTQAAPTPFAMPAFHWKLDDAQVAAVATYARNSWGNRAVAVSAEDVAKLRKALPLAARSDASKQGGGMTAPGPHTLAPADTDSRDNGTPHAGRAVPTEAMPRRKPPEHPQERQDREGGHPGGTPSGGPG